MSNTFSLAEQPKPKAAGFGLLIAPLILSAIGVGLNIWQLALEARNLGEIFKYAPFFGVFLVLELVVALIFLFGIVAIVLPNIRKIAVLTFLLAEFGLVVGYVFINVSIFQNSDFNFAKIYFPVITPIVYLSKGQLGDNWTYLLTDLPFYLNIASIIFAGIYFSKNRSKATPAVTNAFSTAATALNNPVPIANVASATTADAATQSSTPSAQQWEVQLPGAQGYSIDSNALLTYVNAGSIKADTLVKDLNSGTVYQAKQIPGLFSAKSWLTALLLSIFLGQLGIDRFYTGHIGIGIGKLLTLGGFGVWTLVDIILFATKSVKDPQGKVLA